MKIVAEIEDYSKTEDLPSFQFYLEDLKKLVVKICTQIQQHEMIIEPDENEEVKSQTDFKIKSSGEYQGIEWKREKETIDEFFETDVFGNRIFDCELTWDYYLGVVKKDGYPDELSKYSAPLNRTIVISFSRDKCKVRISGENYEWINDTLAVISNFFERRRNDNNEKLNRNCTLMMYSIWLTLFLIAIALIIGIGAINIGGLILIIWVSFLLLFYVLLWKDDLQKRLIMKYPRGQIIIKDVKESESAFEKYLMPFLLTLVNGLTVIVIIESIHKLFS